MSLSERLDTGKLIVYFNSLAMVVTAATILSYKPLVPIWRESELHLKNFIAFFTELNVLFNTALTCLLSVSNSFPQLLHDVFG